MKLQQLKLCVEENKEKFDEILQSDSDRKEIELIRAMKDLNVKQVISRDNQLLTLSKMCSIWIAEKTYKCEHSILENIFSLNEMEEIYTNLKYYCRRFEYSSMPVEGLQEGIIYIMDHHITGIALYNIIEVETWKRENNLLKLAQYLKAEEQIPTAIIMLQLAVEKYDKNERLIMELADCWLEGQQWKQAYETLKKIEKPSKDVKDIIMNLEEVFGYESI